MRSAQRTVRNSMTPKGDRMAKLLTCFEDAKGNVEPEVEDKTHAATAHADVREVLESDPDLTAAGIDTVLIGSYKRQVSIRRVKDVDVLSKLPALSTTKDPQELLDDVTDVLATEYDDDRLVRQDRSIKVLFPDFDLHVDVVPARPAGKYLEIPDRPDDDDDSDGWQQTNPEELTTLSTAMNSRYDDSYVPVVKLVRQARRTNLGKRPGGLFFEILTYHAFDLGLDADCTATLFVGALRFIATQLADVVASGAGVADPTMVGEVISIRCTDAQMAAASTTFSDLAARAEEALADTDDCSAAKAFRDILGKNADDEFVFPMPAACNDDGSRRNLQTIIPGDRTVPAGDGRFA